MRLKVLDFINKNENWEDILSNPPYNLIIKWKEPFVLLKYNQLDSDMFNDIVQECRGLILKKLGKTYKIASMRFKKFFNYGQPGEAKLDFSQPVEVSQKIDGSLIGLWYDKDTGWNVSTSGNIDANDAQLQFQTERLKTYRDLFDLAWENQGNPDMKSFDTKMTYMFELVSPYNRVIVPYKETKLYFLGARLIDEPMSSNKYLMETGLSYGIANNFDMPEIFTCNNIEEIKKAVEKLSNKDEHFEGFVIKDHDGNRIKMKSTEYMNLFFIKGDGIFSYKKILKLILEKKDDDILGYFPEYKDDFDKIREKLGFYVIKIKESLKQTENMLKLNRKEYAEWAKKQINSNILFKLYNKKEQNWDDEWIQEELKSYPIDNLLKKII